MKTNSRSVNIISVLGAVLIYLCGSTVLWATEATDVPLRPQNNAQGSDLVAPYAHFAFSGGGAAGPWSTVYLVSNMAATSKTATIKCYNDTSVRIGPAAGTSVFLSAYNLSFFTPEALGLTTDPAFTGFGWCYFATSNNTIAVGVGTGVRGIAGNPTIFGSNNSRAIAMDAAQAMVTTAFSNLPFWTKQASWASYLVSINPTTTSRTLTVNVYDDAAVLRGNTTPPLSARDMNLLEISALGGTATFGGAEVLISNRGFVGWVAGFNSASMELFFYGVPLFDGTTSFLEVGDRP